ncbi:1,4-alpha-glucan branching protein GlgB [Hydrogenothermus marinus]|uniref:1,4-alpha-glucan branching enzyme GlgB n=1 Tax=Hydrogenothermus marinus TaxID=133270 RepID=A0A3M0BS98_9AQUI|nr:1,4-alpha-glucan branching protein GlgB [Hydrogenothermus marinus]RMA97708.1 1,4-alpha-glucan branching enzyme [Hydrogenothermus marinus]
MHKIYYDISRFTDFDIYLFKEGTHRKLYEKFGAHFMEREGKKGVYFSVWAPNAEKVSVIGDFNNYDDKVHPLKKREDGSGIWEGFIEGVQEGLTYKYKIYSKHNGIVNEKSDPYGFFFEKPPKSATITYDIKGYQWKDKDWMENRIEKNNHLAPINIYEVHLGSWKRKLNNQYLTYTELAEELVKYVKEMGYTHIELMPITEYPFDGSWGYQTVGYFAPTSRFGTPKEFMQFVDIMHQNDIGVIIDWVPSHFAVDGHGLINFDGTPLYEHPDPRMAYHPEWGSAIFDYGKNEVRAFLISSAMFWFEKYHIDGIRVDAVASMLYLDYARKEGEWIPNKYGGNENLEAIEFLKQLNKAVYEEFTDIMTIAEESTAFPMVSKPVYLGGLGFGFKWNMGWMHDTLNYMKVDPLFRQYHHHQLTFSFVYMYNENYILPLSHDEVVHMKGSLINKMPGDYDQKFSNLRALFAYMTAFPGKKLLFMGGEIAQWKEWNYKESLDWNLLDYPKHRGVQNLVKQLNNLYKNEKALHQYDCEAKGFEWIDELDYKSNVISFIRKSDNDFIIIVCNFSGITRENYRIGVPEEGIYKEIFNSQYKEFGGLDIKNEKPIKSKKVECHGRKNSISLTLPPLSVIYLKKL